MSDNMVLFEILTWNYAFCNHLNLQWKKNSDVKKLMQLHTILKSPKGHVIKRLKTNEYPYATEWGRVKMKKPRRALCGSCACQARKLSDDFWSEEICLQWSFSIHFCGSLLLVSLNIIFFCRGHGMKIKSANLLLLHWILKYILFLWSVLWYLLICDWPSAHLWPLQLPATFTWSLPFIHLIDQIVWTMNIS